jgi:CubicO group peptidase (beta-lactamase class C family)
MRLVEQGRVDLDAPVRRYIPELRLQDESVAERVTVLQLTNHTSGWAGDFFADTGYGDDALARYVEKLAEVEQEAPLGERVSYSNSAFTVAGRVIEKVTGKPFEAAVSELVFQPLGLHEHFYFPWEIMVRRFAAGHARVNGVNQVVPWYESRSGHPQGGGISASARDQIRYARFHMGDGGGILRRETLEQMQTPTTPYVTEGAKGIAWALSEIDGVKIVAHGGSTRGHQTGFEMVPEQRFALVTFTNARHGTEFNEEIKTWAFEAYLGLAEAVPDPLELSADQLREYAGLYDSFTGVLTVVLDGDRLIGTLEPNPEMLAEFGEEAQEGEELVPPLPFKILPENQFLVIDGAYKGMRGGIVRGAEGRLTGLDLGRVFTKRE